MSSRIANLTQIKADHSVKIEVFSRMKINIAKWKF